METVYLANHIKRTVTGPMWHGSSLGELLDGVTASQATERPVAGAHTIWEIVLHVTVWSDVALARLRGGAVDPTPEQDWPRVEDPSDAAWKAAVDRLRESHRSLAHETRRLDDVVLHEKIPGLDYSRSNLLHGVIEHGTYHGGQIAILKKGATP